MAHDAVTAIVEAYAETVAEVAHEEMGHHITHLGQDASHPDLWAAAAEQAGVMRAETAALLRSAVDTGSLRAGTDVDRLARAVHLTFNGSLVAWALDAAGATAPETVRADITTVLSPHRVEAR